MEIVSIKHYKELPLAREIKWTKELRQKYIKALLRFTSCEYVSQLKNRRIPMSVWQKMEKELNVERHSLRRLWWSKAYAYYFYYKKCKYHEVCIELIEFLYKNKIIDVQIMAAKFDGLHMRYLSEMFYYLIRKAKKKINSSRLIDHINYLHTYYIPELKKKNTRSSVKS